MNVAILITSYNRKDVTISSIYSLSESIKECSNIYFDIYLVDDGSNDGTYKAIQENFPKIKLIKGNGNLFWGGGMNKAWKEAARSVNKYDGYVWFNDDSILCKDALLNLFSVVGEMELPVIVSGAFISSDNKFVTYGGRLRNSTSFVEPNGDIQTIELINGNLTYIPSIIFNKIGYIDTCFRHGLGDYDYGLRAIKHGFQCVLTPKYVGISDRHDELLPKCYNIDITLCQRLRILYSPLYNPMNELIFYSRHYNLIKAFKMFIAKHLYTFFPKFLNN